jgi:hypothetical protein
VFPRLELSRSTGRGSAASFGQGNSSHGLTDLSFTCPHQHPHYRNIGRLAVKLFRGCIAKQFRLNFTELRLAVHDSRKKFKKKLGDHLQDLEVVLLTDHTL